MTEREAWKVEAIYFSLGPCDWYFAAMNPESELYKAKRVLANNF